MVKISDGGDWGDEDRPARPRHREEALYVSEEYKIFMIAGTPCGFTHDPNQISVRPFHTLPAGKLEAMRAIAKPWTTETQNECDITLYINEGNLELTDGYSKVKSKFPISELDDDVRAQILYKIKWRGFGSEPAKEIDPWQKYYDAADKVNLPSPDVSTSHDTTVQRPLTLKKGGLNL